MTPARKKALDHIYMNGGDDIELQALRDQGKYAPTVKMLILLQVDNLIEYEFGGFTLTDAGRRALNGDSK